MLILLGISIKEDLSSLARICSRYVHFAYLSPAVEMNISLVVAFDCTVIAMLEQ